MNHIPRQPKRSRWPWRIAGLVVALLGFNWYVVAAADFTPRDLTESVMATIEQRVRLAASQKLDIPENLSDLPTIAGKLSGTADAWGRPIILEQIGAEVTLISLGKDARPGGAGLDADIMHRFAINN